MKEIMECHKFPFFPEEVIKSTDISKFRGSFLSGIMVPGCVVSFFPSSRVMDNFEKDMTLSPCTHLQTKTGTHPHSPTYRIYRMYTLTRTL